ncbi:MAG: hypothetical protein OXR73_08410 [Myxococcales bacterium]|nr:hypothetical protein [Myxococcales bacterium]
MALSLQWDGAMMLNVLRTGLLSVVFVCSSAQARPPVAWAPSLPALEALGKRVFFDPISEPDGQACASCHASTAGWTAGDSLIHAGPVVVPGADPTTAGNRKPPSISYASFAPPFGDFPGRECTPDGSALSCSGGLFWDGRATGASIGEEVFAGRQELKDAYEAFLGPTADQALGPFPNDVEMNVPDGNDDGLPGAEFVCRHVQAADYAGLYRQAWGEPIRCDISQVAVSFKRIAVAISAWEHSAEVNSFSSPRDRALSADYDGSPGSFPLSGFSDLENLGHDLFFGITSELNPAGKDARCAACHNSEGRGSAGEEPEQLYTDHRFHHLGIPANHEAANFDPDAPDFGLSHHTSPQAPGDTPHAGHYRTPTLRNVDARPHAGFTKAYMHNGYFKSLEDVVHFYNTALVKLDPKRCPAGTTAAEARARDCWPEAEVDNGRQASLVGLLGDLGLTEYEEAALVAYMKTLSDTEIVAPPSAHKPAKPYQVDKPSDAFGGHRSQVKRRAFWTWLRWLLRI